MAGQYAGKAASNACTQENLDYALEHNTAENREKAYDGACWANDKADEMGIDKTEVAKSVGSGLWSGMKAAFTFGSE